MTNRYPTHDELEQEMAEAGRPCYGCNTLLDWTTTEAVLHVTIDNVVTTHPVCMDCLEKPGQLRDIYLACDEADKERWKAANMQLHVFEEVEF